MADSGISSDTINMSLHRPMKDDEKWGYSIDTTLGGEFVSMAPMLTYRVIDDIEFTCQINVDSQHTMRNIVGLMYKFDPSRVCHLQLVSSFNDNWITLVNTNLIL